MPSDSGWRTIQEKDNLFKVPEARENVAFSKNEKQMGATNSRVCDVL